MGSRRMSAAMRNEALFVEEGRRLRSGMGEYRHLMRYLSSTVHLRSRIPRVRFQVLEGVNVNLL